MMASVSAIAPASATTIDFSALPYRTAVTNQYDGVTFSMTGGPVQSATPVTDGSGLTNSADANYPTADFLNADFTTTASNVSFNFDNYGNNSYFGNGGSSYSAFAADGSLIASGNLSAANGESFNVVGSGIKTLRFSNGRDGSGNSWIYTINSFSFTAAAVPEPATWAMMILGMGAIGFAMRRSNKKFDAKIKSMTATVA